MAEKADRKKEIHDAFFGKKKDREQKSWQYWVSTIAVFLLWLFLILCRSTELVSMGFRSPLYAFLILSSGVSLLSLFLSPPRTFAYYARRVVLSGMVVLQLKSEIDFQLLSKFSLASHSKASFAKLLDGHVSIVTGANSGTGYAVSEQLSMLGATVVMACRSLDKCKEAAGKIRESVAKVRGGSQGKIETLVLDLADLGSVRRFANEVKKKYRRLDHLVLNAGSVPQPGSLTAQGLENCLGSMHVGHFALTKWLQDLLLRPVKGIAPAVSSSRVVYVSSLAYMSGNFHPSLFKDSGRGDWHGEITDNCGNFGPGGVFPCCPIGRCPNTNGYGRAKLANVLHLHELQRRVDELAVRRGGSLRQRRLVTASLHPGGVHTNIHPFLASSLSSIVLRSPEEASRIIMSALLSDAFVPGSFLDAMGRAHDLQDFRSLHLEQHLKAFPEAQDMSFTTKGRIKIPSFDLWHWEKAELVRPFLSKTKTEVAQRLWDVTEKIVTDFEWGKRHL